MIRHAGLIARFARGGWRGVLVEGPSGIGKSDLALRAIETGWALVADDRTLIWACDAQLWGRAPEALAGLVEARGLGVLAAAQRPLARIALIVRCVTVGEPARLPAAATMDLLGVTLPMLEISALEASAPYKLDLALSHLGLGLQRGYQASLAGQSPPGAGGVP